MAGVTLRRDPFRLDRELLTVPPGHSVREIVADLLGEGFLPHVRCTLDGRQLGPHELDAVPGEGSRLEIVVQPAGGAARPLLSLAVVVASIIAAPYLTPAALTSAVGGAATANAITAAVLSGLGNLLVNALVPPPSLVDDGYRQSQTWAVEGVRNAVRPWQPIPRVYGRVRMTPPVAATPAAQIRDGNQDLRVGLCWGYGELQLEQLRVGETDFATFASAQHEFWPGRPGAGPPSFTLYAEDVDVQDVGAVLPEQQPEFSVVRTAHPDATECEVILLFPGGLAGIPASGTIAGRSTDIRIETAPTGTASWTVVATDTISAKTTRPFRRSYRFPVSGHVDVRVTRIWKHHDRPPMADEMRWMQLLSYQQRNPFVLDGVAFSAIRFRASDQVSGSLDRINAVVTSIAPDWDAASGSWITRATTNPASLARLCLQGQHNREPVPDEELDLEAFRDWHEWCEARGLSCGLVVDWDADTDSVLQVVAATGHAVVRRGFDGLWRPVIDRAQPVAVQMFTPRNAREVSASWSLAPLPHALRVQFANAAKGWRRDEILVYADGYDAATATRFETLELPGVTDATQAWRAGRRRLAEMAYRHERWSFRTDFEALCCTIGDRIELAFDVIDRPLAAARIVSLVKTGSGDVVAADLDVEVEFGTGSYGAAIRSVSAVRTWPLQNGAGATRQIVFATPIPAAQAPEEGDLVTVGELGAETVPAIVQSMTFDRELECTVTAVRYDERVYAADTETPPADIDRTPVTAPVSYAPPVLVAGTVSILEQGGVTVAEATVAIEHPAGRPPDARGVVVQWREVGSGAEWSELAASATASSVTLGQLLPDTQYEVRARYDSDLHALWSSTLVIDTSAGSATRTGEPLRTDGTDQTLALRQYLESELAAGRTRIAVSTPPGQRVRIDGLVRIEQPDPTRHVTIDLGGMAIDAGRAFRISIRGVPVELPDTQTFLLDQDAPAGSTTLRVRTSPQGGDHSLLQPGYEIVVRGQNDAAGNVLPGQKYEGVITSKTVISTFVVEIGIDPPLPEDFLVSYPASAWREEGGGVDQTHITVRIPLRLAADARGDLGPVYGVTVSDDPSLAGVAPGDVVLLVDDFVAGDVQGSSTMPIRREMNIVDAISGTGPWTVGLRHPVRRDFLVSRSARLLKVAAAHNVRLICPRDVVFVQPPDPPPASRVPVYELRYAVGCALEEATLDDRANPNGYAPRGPVVRVEHAIGCRVERVSRIGRDDPADAVGGDRYGCYVLHSRLCHVRVGRFERCRHGLVWWNCTDCTSEGGVFHDCLINGVDWHGAWNVGCFHHGGLFVAGPTRAPDASQQSAVTFGNTFHQAGDYDCGIFDAVFLGFTDLDGAVEIRTPCGGIVVSGTAYGCLRAIALKQTGTIDGGAVIVPRFHQIGTPSGGRFLGDVSGAPRFAPVVLGEIWSDADEPHYWPWGDSGIAPVARQNFALHAQRYTGVSGAFEVPYTRGQWVDVELVGDVTSFTVTTDHLARPDDLLTLYVRVRQDAVGGHAWAHPANTVWPGGAAPAVTTAPGKSAIFRYLSHDGGQSWIGLLVADDL